MALKPGTQVGPYEITAPIGAGGMGEVYRATDTKLKREVAIKVLPDDVARDGNRLARFEREAHVLASLNHPHIASIYGLEESDGVPCLVLELVEGQTLAERLAAGALPVEQALEIAEQIASAVEAAHEKGIIHRDLKPANVKITPEGSVKVLDFGLAKALADETTEIPSDPSHSPTVTISATRAGVILGTAAYMSPEQARAKPVDKRTDIWAFGCLLYEMLTGRRAFPGETASDSIARILEREPDWRALPASAPLRIQELLQRCLRKDRRNRLHDIADARIEIEDAGGVEGAPRWPSRARLSRVVLVALMLLAAVSILVVGWSLYAVRADRDVTRLTISMPVGYEITSAPAISPDGRQVAYTARDAAGRSGLYVRGLNEYVPRLLVDTGEPVNPFFSPDGRHLGFFGDDQLWRVDVGGGAPTALADAPIAFGGTWGPRGDIVFTPNLNSGLVRIKATGGAPEQLTVPDFADGGYAHVWPHFDLDGRGLTFTIWVRGNKSTARLSLESLQWKKVAAGAADARLLGSRHLLQSDQEGGLRSVPLQAGDEQARSEPITVLATPVYHTYAVSRPWYDIAANGDLIYVPTSGFKHRLTWVTRESGETEEIAEDEAAEIALSPDGERVMYTVRGSLWMYDLVRESRTQIESQPMIFTPEWAPDGDRIYFSANRGGDWDLYTKSVTGTSPATRLLEKPHAQHVAGIAKDGTIAFWDTPPESRTTLWVVPPGEQPRLLLDSDFGASRARFSPKGDLLAYTVAASQQSHAEVFVTSYPDRAERLQVSRAGGQEPVWSPDGKELFYRDGDDILSVAITTDGGLRVGVPTIELRDLSIAKTWANYRISPDGERFLVLQRDPAAVPRQINVILNWRQEFNEVVAGN